MVFHLSPIAELLTIDLFDNNLDVKKLAMKRLAEFSANDDSVQEMLRLCAFCPIMGIMLSHSDSAEVIVSGCTIFGNLIRLANEEQLDAFIDLGFVDVTVSAILRAPNQFVLLSILGIIGQLASRGYFSYAMNSFYLDRAIDLSLPLPAIPDE